jgi:dimethylamine--corrinoid protein Co-methyltransferase
MGGLRTAGDLVARMQMTRGMRIKEAKTYVADKLAVTVKDLHDPVIMREVREDKQLGVLQPKSGSPKGMEVKRNIAKVLDIDINSLASSHKRIMG